MSIDRESFPPFTTARAVWLTEGQRQGRAPAWQARERRPTSSPRVREANRRLWFRSNTKRKEEEKKRTGQNKARKRGHPPGMNSARRRAAARPLEEPEVRNPQALEPRRRQSLEGRTKVDGKSWGGRELRWTWIAGGRSTGRSLRSARGFHGNKVSSFRLNLPPTCWWGIHPSN